MIMMSPRVLLLGLANWSKPSLALGVLVWIILSVSAQPCGAGIATTVVMLQNPA
jgi:hypothetical protein